MRKAFVLTVWLSLLTLVVTIAWAKPNFQPINTFDDIEFSSYEKSWIDQTEQINAEVNNVVKRAEQKEGRRLMTIEIQQIKAAVEKTLSESKGPTLLMHLANDGNTVAYRLGISMPDSVGLRFQRAGALLFTIQVSDSQQIQVPDMGIFCILEHKPVKWLDTRKQPVLFDNSFNRNAPGDLPKVVVVRIPREREGKKLYGLPIVKVELTDNCTREDRRSKIAFH